MEERKIALVTGATRGLGLETCRQLGKLGMSVLLGARDANRGEAAAEGLRAEGIDAHFLHVDMDDPSTFATASDVIQAEFGKLDVLVNNAGICLEPFGTSCLSTTPEILEETFRVNLFALIGLTQTLMPLLKSSAAARIVNLSSILGSVGTLADPANGMEAFQSPAYGMAKSALNAFTVHLAGELRGTPIKVNAAHPGWVKTDMGGAEAPMSLEDGVATTVALATLPADGPTGTFVHMGKPLPW